MKVAAWKPEGWGLTGASSLGGWEVRVSHCRDVVGQKMDFL